VAIKARWWMWMVLVAGGAARAEPSEYDLGWIGKIPGITATVRQRSADSHRAVYALTGDTEATFEGVRVGLERRGWAIEEPTQVNVAGLAVRTLQATKGSATAQIVATGTEGAVNLEVVLEGAPRRSESRAPAPAPDAPASKEDITLLQGNLTETYRCDGNAINVLGGNNHLTLLGRCRALIMRGGHNVVRIDGSIELIEAVGSGNTITWAPEANPAPPEVRQIGTNNHVYAAHQ
jgi:hypothetical protein